MAGERRDDGAAAVPLDARAERLRRVRDPVDERGAARREGRRFIERADVGRARRRDDAHEPPLRRREPAPGRDRTAATVAARAERGERVRDRAPVRRATGWLLRQHARDQRGERRGRLRRDLGERRRLRDEDLRDDGAHVVGGERRLAREAPEEDAAEREHVGARVDVLLAARLLGRHVPGRADRDAGRRELGLGAPRDAEVDDLHAAHVALDEQDVPRLEVAVHDAVRVRLCERRGDRRHHEDRVLDRERRGGEAVRQRLAVDPLHGEERRAGRRRAVEHVAYDGRVPERREERRLTLEADVALRALFVQDLERDGFAREPIHRAVHGAHRAVARGALDREPARDDVARLHDATRGAQGRIEERSTRPS